ncbi:MAG TPA: hypothetical protein DF383_00650 [Deltaproteobacteria bacterium]|nr:hypothetical protein [Deltaproteobacteria bacterium]
MAAEAKKCSIKDCKRPYRAKSYCNVHYKKWRQGDYGHKRYKTCSQESCKKPMGKRGLCDAHYEAWLKSRKTAVAVAETAAAPAEAAPSA